MGIRVHACASKNDPREGEHGDVGRRALIAGVKFWKGVVLEGGEREGSRR